MEWVFLLRVFTYLYVYACVFMCLCDLACLCVCVCVSARVCVCYSQVAWQNYQDAGSFLDVDTSGCKFSEDSVMYFTEMFGQGGQWTGMGQTAIYSSTMNGFRVYVLFLFVHFSVCMYVCVRFRTYIFVCSSMCACLQHQQIPHLRNLCVYIYFCVCICVYMRFREYACVCVCVCACICVRVCTIYSSTMNRFRVYVFILCVDVSVVVFMCLCVSMCVCLPACVCVRDMSLPYERILRLRSFSVRSISCACICVYVLSCVYFVYVYLYVRAHVCQMYSFTMDLASIYVFLVSVYFPSCMFVTVSDFVCMCMCSFVCVVCTSVCV